MLKAAAAAVAMGAFVGSRICLGATFAMAEAQIMMATILARFRLSIDGDRPVMPVGRLTIEPSHVPMFRLESV